VAASRSLKKTLFAEKCNKYFFEKEPFENTVVMEVSPNEISCLSLGLIRYGD